MDETYIKVKGNWHYLYRAVNKENNTIDFLLIQKRDKKFGINYLNNIIKQDHRAIKRITRGMLGFKSFESTSITLNGIEMVRMIRKGQIEFADKSVQNSANKFYSLAE